MVAEVQECLACLLVNILHACKPLKSIQDLNQESERKPYAIWRELREAHVIPSFPLASGGKKGRGSQGQPNACSGSLHFGIASLQGTCAEMKRPSFLAEQYRLHRFFLEAYAILDELEYLKHKTADLGCCLTFKGVHDSGLHHLAMAAFECALSAIKGVQEGSLDCNQPLHTPSAMAMLKPVALEVVQSKGICADSRSQGHLSGCTGCLIVDVVLMRRRHFQTETLCIVCTNAETNCRCNIDADHVHKQAQMKTLMHCVLSAAH